MLARRPDLNASLILLWGGQSRLLSLLSLLSRPYWQTRLQRRIHAASTTYIPPRLDDGKGW